jgi:ribosome-binding factor A
MAKRSSIHGSGPTQRQLRVGETIRRALADILIRGDHHEPDLEGVPITVGEVRCTSDLRIATVFVMPLGGRDAERVMAGLENWSTSSSPPNCASNSTKPSTVWTKPAECSAMSGSNAIWARSDAAIPGARGPSNDYACDDDLKSTQ